jgi:Flp pilus assembly protein TadD
MRKSSTRVGLTLLAVTLPCGIISYILSVATQASSVPPIVSSILGIVAVFIVIVTGLLGNQAATALQPNTDDTVSRILQWAEHKWTSIQSRLRSWLLLGTTIMLIGIFVVGVWLSVYLSADAFFGRGNAHFDQGEYDQAIADYTEVIKHQPSRSQAYFKRGAAYHATANHQKALVDYIVATQLDPKLAEAFNKAGELYLLKNPDFAVPFLSEAIRLKPDYAEAYKTRGQVYIARNEHEKAITDFTKALALNPDYADAYVSRGVAYLGKGDQKAANDDFTNGIAAADRMLQKNPNDAWAYFARGSAYNVKGEKEKAIADYEKVLELSRDVNLLNLVKALLVGLKG